MENSETILLGRVSRVVFEDTELCELRAYVGIVAGSNSRHLHIVPVSVSVSAGDRVVGDNIISSGQPPASRGLVGVKA